MKNRTFTLDDQISFAKLSGDYNPLHTEPVMARRLIFGRPVVHGAHALLWAVDQLLEKETEFLALKKIKVFFQNPIGLEEKIEFSATCEDTGRADIRLVNASTIYAKIQIEWDYSKKHKLNNLPSDFPQYSKCKDLSPEEAANISGSIKLCLNKESAVSHFPNLMRVLPSVQLAEILATTRLIGMECPGLHSLYSDLDLIFYDENEGNLDLKYRAAKFDKRFSLLTIEVNTPGMKGRLKAFFRPPPQSQISYDDLLPQVRKNEFSDQRAFIIGGSRGLGEVTSKVLSAGGADVTFTYFRGKDDARRIVDEITTYKGKINCIPYDVLNPPKSLKSYFGEKSLPNHIYFFATPFIAKSTDLIFSPKLFQEFCNYYVGGLVNSFKLLRELGSEVIKIFYPSTVFIDELPVKMGEYLTAKMAGETLCAFIEKTDRKVKIFKPRLPMMATDQTNSISKVLKQDTFLEILKNLRLFKDL